MYGNNPVAEANVGAAAVHFTPGARTAWHTHPHGQTIWVTEGVGLCQKEGRPIEVIRPGDRVFFEPDASGVPQHEGIYIGDGKFVEAPHTGDVVKISTLDDPHAGLTFVGAVRPYVR